MAQTFPVTNDPTPNDPIGEIWNCFQRKNGTVSNSLRKVVPTMQNVDHEEGRMRVAWVVTNFGLCDAAVANVYLYGRRVYGTHGPNSDWVGAFFFLLFHESRHQNVGPNPDDGDDGW